MKTSLSTILSLVVGAAIGNAQPFPFLEFSAPKALLHSVAIGANTITMVLSGECTFPVAQKTKTDGGWNGELMTVTMDRAVLTFSRTPHDDPSWEETCRTAKSLEGKLAHIGLTSESLLFKRGKLVEITCQYASFHPQESGWIPDRVIVGGGVSWTGNESWNTVEYRRAFLLGMSEWGISGDPAGPWPNEMRAEAVYEMVAKIHARDIGIEPDKIASGDWKTAVAQSLRSHRNDAAAVSGMPKFAFLSGVYARWGTPMGFRFSGAPQGYEVAQMISRFNDFKVQLVHQPGYPGRTTITILDGGEAPGAGFFTLMSWIEASVKKEPNQP